MKINKIGFGGTVAFVLGAVLTVLPASATTISFTTAGSPTDVGVAGADFNYTGANVSSFDPTAGTFFSGTTAGTSFGDFVFASGTPTSSVVNVNLSPTVNGGAAAVVDFQGTISSVIVGGTTLYTVNFGSTPGATNITTGALSGYTELTQNGINYAVQTTEQLSSGTPGKMTYLAGFIQGVSMNITPEPATMATTGLALLLGGLLVRRKATARS